MSRMEAVFLDRDDTSVDDEAICSRAYVTMFRGLGIYIDLREIFTCLKGVKLYETIDIISKEQGVMMAQTDVEHVYRAEIARLFDTELEGITGADELPASINVLMYVVSSGPVSKMQHSLGKLNVLHYFPEKSSSGYDARCWKPDPVLVFHAAKAMNADVESCILVDDSSVGAQSGIDAGMEVFHLRVDLYNKPIVCPEVTVLTHLSQLPELWKICG